ncbi:hypothetical protein [Sphaerisporangium sp. TRM90804]|uniref:hypothetical protein n=1 Tax=Sphaerisporangium sp. TRM90804 TaxID=3031113 RepID=UPI00244D2DE2|nr:hypothetical protein [Sphaerisporangium sp. TRM90804]MDH2425735.1 hypothetical protein [Sphaerisporangium sp. TRM90804]
MPPTIRETRIGEETVSALDYFSRLIGAIEDGNWRYARDKLRQLQNTLATLAAQLDRKSPAAGPPVAAYVARESLHYRIGKALYRPPAGESTRPEVADDDPRFTAGLLIDVQAVLEQHGYRLPDAERDRHQALGGLKVALLAVVRTFEGGAQ